MGRRASALGSARTGSRRKEAGSKGAGHILEEGEKCSVVLQDIVSQLTWVIEPVL